MSPAPHPSKFLWRMNKSEIRADSAEGFAFINQKKRMGK